MRDLKIALVCLVVGLLTCVACNRFEKNHEQISSDNENVGDIRDVTAVKDTLRKSSDRDTIIPNVH